MYARVYKRVRARDQISMNRSMVGIPYLGARNPHCPEYPLIHEILVGILSSGDSVQWGFRPVGIPGGNRWDLIQFSAFIRDNLQPCSPSSVYILDWHLR